MMSFISLSVCIIGVLLFIADVSFSAPAEVITAELKKPNYRLNTDVEPIVYTIEVTPYFDGKKVFTFDGTVEIQLKTREKNVDEIVLHIEDLDIKRKTLTKKPGFYAPFPFNLENLSIKGDKYDKTTSKYTIQLTKPLVRDEVYTLTFEYVGNLQSDMHGFYRSSYLGEDGKIKWLASTQMQPVHARKVFPCFDEPRFKSEFNIIINRPKDFQPSISNMPIAGSYMPSSNVVKEIFQTTPKMSTYLVAFIVSDFDCRRTKVDDFSVCARPRAYNQTEYSFDVGQKILAEYDGLFKYPYNKQMSKMAMAAIPDFSAGAMENWGLLTYRETALLYDPSVATSMAQQRVASVVAHEQAHMWFGDLVTCDWWSHTWLNEGFARFFEYFGTAMVETEWGLEQQFVVDQVQNVFTEDSLEASLPLSYDNINTPAEIQDRFGGISYSKGGSVIRMIQHAIGHDTFIAALRNYLKKNELQTTVPEKLFEAFQNEVGKKVDMSEFMGSWVYNPGYPLIHVTVDDDRKHATIKQKRFLRNDPNHKDETLYQVPINFASDKENSDFRDTSPYDILKEEKLKIKFSEPVDWVIFNVQQTGYYRVTYDEATWNAIANGLHNSHSNIHVLNRAQIVDDVLTLARAGLHDYKNALHTIHYLNNEIDYVPWKAAFVNFDFILQRFVKDDAQIFEEFILQLLNKAYDHLGFKPKDKEHRLDVYNRANILKYACKFGHEGCVKDARAEFDHLTEGNYVIPKDIAPIVYCSAIAEGSKKEWDFLWDKCMKTNVAAEQVAILTSLGCAKDPTLIKQYFERILSNDIRLQDKHAALTSTYQYQQNLDLVLDFVINNHKDIDRAFESKDEVPDMLSLIVGRVTTNEQFEKAKKFATLNGLESRKDVRVALENAAINLKWADKNIPVIKDAVKSMTGDATTKTMSCIVFLSAIALYFL